jgi:hypothetical protein
MLFAPSVSVSFARPPLPPPDMRAAPGKAGWSVDERTGCWVWNASPERNQTVHWNEGCSLVGRATGSGILEWRSDGKVSRYEGEIRYGELNGRGIHTAPNGDRYEGEFREGKPNGRGVTTMTSGQRLAGEFRDGVMHGHGAFTSANGNRFEGEWRDGRADGHGVYKQKNGELFEGKWVDGCFREGDMRIAVGRPANECR